MSEWVKVEVAGATLELNAERAAYWRARRTLLVADPHFGKAASFRAAGVFVPEATTSGTLARLDVLLAATGASRIVFLGDFLHARNGRHPETLVALNAWRDRHAAVEMLIVRGNHDKRAGDPPRALRIRCEDGPLLEPPFAFAHYPVALANHYVLGGHVHPAATLAGRGRQRERLPCFVFRRDVGILPAFGEFTGVAEVNPETEDRVWVVGEGRVLAVTNDRAALEPEKKKRSGESPGCTFQESEDATPTRSQE